MGQVFGKPAETGKKIHSYYQPAVSEIVLSKDANDNLAKKKRVAVVGSGCAGLAAAWHLNRSGVDVILFESNGKLGGHANTINVDGVDVDTGFMVYNSLNYPNLCAFFEEVGVEGINTTMGFSISMDNGKLEWCAETFSGLLATPSNATNPQFYAMMRDIFKFNQVAHQFLQATGDDEKIDEITVSDFLVKHGLSNAFRDLYLVPMTAAIWSATFDDVLNFPILTLLTFLNNHLLLQVSDHIEWKTPKHRSQEYVNKIAKELGDRAKVNTPIHKVERIAKTNDQDDINNDSSSFTIRLTDGSNNTYEFDEVVFACHPDQALKILGNAATEDEKKWLGEFIYDENETYVHCDENLMPKSKSAWTSWNYLTNSKLREAATKPVFVTYWLNKLQSLNHPKPILVSLNPFHPPDSSKTFAKIMYSHPQYTVRAIKAQKQVNNTLQGRNGTYYCGAWMGYGFHEDGFRTGIEIASAISEVAPPWVKKWGRQAMIPTSVQKAADPTLFASAVNLLVTRPITFGLEWFCQRQVLQFIQKGFLNGRLQILMPDGSSQVFVGEKSGQEVTIKVRNGWFFVRLALEADLGLARSYIAGEWEIENTGPYYDGLTRFLLLLIDNMPTGIQKKESAIDADKLATAWIGTAINAVWHRVIMDNTIFNSQSNIHSHYDLSNDLFRTFLDDRHMMYSSALFETSLISGKLSFLGSLEDAQTRKIDTLLSKLEPITPEHSLLDIGFGWGGISIRAAEKYGCKVTGITLSVEQKAFAEERVRAKGLSHLITFELVDYRVFVEQSSSDTDKKFDRIVSCEMIEAVGHNHLGSYFAAVESLLATDGIFVMQAITMPDSRYPVYVKSADFCNTIIFPGGCCPSLSALLTAMAENSTLYLDNAMNANIHYAETLRRWRRKFNDHLPKIYSIGFDDAFIRLWNLYLCYCEAGFDAQIINLQILTFSRPGNRNMMMQARGVAISNDNNNK